MHARMVIVAALCAALGTAGCGSDATPPAASTGPASGLGRLATASRSERDAALGASALAVEQELAAVSGLATALGGAAKATAALQSLGRAWPQAKAPATSFGREGPRLPADTKDIAYTLDYANTTAGAELAGWVGDPPTDGQPGSATASDSTGGFTSTTTRSAETGTSVVDQTVKGSQDGVEGTSHVRVESQPCPDPSGTFTVTVKMSTLVAAQSGGAGWSTSTTVTVTGHVDDNADLVGWEADAGWDASTSGGGAATQKASGTYGFTMTGSTLGGEHSSGSLDVRGTTPAFAQNWMTLTSLKTYTAGQKAVEAARTAWQSGRCVRIRVTTDPASRSALQPNTSVSITAAPRSTVDGAPTGGTVTGSLSGPQSLDPDGHRVDADAKFIYLAADTTGKTGTVSLEARSRRGVGRTSVDLTTGGAFTVRGTLGSRPETTFTGCIPRATEPFTVDFAGANVGTISFTPSSGTAGSWTWDGEVSNAPMPEKGSGTYTITTTDGGGSLTLKGKVDTDRLVNHYTAALHTSLTLTPTAAC